MLVQDIYFPHFFWIIFVVSEESSKPGGYMKWSSNCNQVRSHLAVLGEGKCTALIPSVGLHPFLCTFAGVRSRGAVSNKERLYV